MTEKRSKPNRLRFALMVSGCLAALLPGNSWGQTLEDALSAAYLNNPRLLGSRAELRATNEAVPQARSGWRPRVELNATAGVNRHSTDMDLGLGWETEYRRPTQVELGVSQPIYRGGRTQAGV